MPNLLLPAVERAHVEMAVVADIAAEAEAETFLWIEFHRADAAKIQLAWTAGGNVAGDRIDALARSAGWTACDWFHQLAEHKTVRARGRIWITAHPLRPIEADLASGRRCPADQTERWDQAVGPLLDGSWASESPGTWLGVGPASWASPPTALNMQHDSPPAR